MKPLLQVSIINILINQQPEINMEFLRTKNLNYTNQYSKQCVKLQINSSKNQRRHLPRNFMLKIKTTFAAVNIVVRHKQSNTNAHTNTETTVMIHLFADSKYI